jgi:hypothetical protein
MEKPLLNLRNGVNFLRYHYFFGDFYYYLVVSQITILIGLVAGAIDLLIDRKFTWSLLTTLIVLGILFISLSILIHKVFFEITLNIILKSAGIATLIGLGFFSGFYLVFSPDSNSSFAILGYVILTGSIMGYIHIERSIGRINIFPNRVTIQQKGLKDLVFYYKDITNVKMLEDHLEKNLTPEVKAQNVQVLTKIVPYSEGEDFTIYHFYPLIEHQGTAYILQPEVYMNTFAQNVINGWKETWRWDGTKVMPIGWKKAN